MKPKEERIINEIQSLKHLEIISAHDVAEFFACSYNTARKALEKLWYDGHMERQMLKKGQSKYIFLEQKT